MNIVPLIVAGAVAAAPGAEPTADDWRAITIADVDAAHALILENHPGAAPEMKDEAFRSALESGWRLARDRAGTVSDYDGYAATLRGFATGLGDRHLAWSPTQRPGTLRYPGFLVNMKGRDWVVVAADEANGPAVGDRVASCDGLAVDELARSRIAGFRADAAIPAQMIRAAPWLMLDDGNPFVPRPVRCVFERAGESRTYDLSWRDLAPADLQKTAASALRRPAAGFGVRTFAGGAWIAMERLDGEAARVNESVKARWAELRNAPVIVVDVRGNGGGDSSIGDDLALQLFGAKALQRASVGKPGCAPVWRASEGNARTLESYQIRFADRPGASEAFRTEADAVRAAMAAGRALSGEVPARCLQEPTPPVAPARPAANRPYGGQVVILTDNVCFSSCLLMVQRFRALGAVQAGQATNGGTWYMEARHEPLPSGLGDFGVLGKVAPAAPRRLGPFEPTAPFDGDMSDDAALESWIAETFAR